MMLDGERRRGCPKMKWEDSVKLEMEELALPRTCAHRRRGCLILR